MATSGHQCGDCRWTAGTVKQSGFVFLSLLYPPSVSRVLGHHVRGKEVMGKEPKTFYFTWNCLSVSSWHHRASTFYPANLWPPSTPALFVHLTLFNPEVSVYQQGSLPCVYMWSICLLSVGIKSMCYHAQLSMWVCREGIKVWSPCFLGKHFPAWLIIPAPGSRVALLDEGSSRWVILSMVISQSLYLYQWWESSLPSSLGG